jgi:hypothetical protein
MKTNSTTCTVCNLEFNYEEKDVVKARSCEVVSYEIEGQSFFDMMRQSKRIYADHHAVVSPCCHFAVEIPVV